MKSVGPPDSPGTKPALNAETLALVADAVICTDADGRILTFNPAAERSFGYSASEVIGHSVHMLLPLRDRTDHHRHLRGFASGEGVTTRLMGRSREVRGRRKNGEEFPSEAMVSRQTIDGRVILTVVHRDITERKELEELREATSRELEHRMRNQLSVVSSIVSISAASASSVEEFRAVLADRLTALAASQYILRAGGGTSADLGELLRKELAQYRTQQGTNVTVLGPPVSLGPKAAQILAMIAHELATNSAKYGALSRVGGQVAVRFAFVDNESGGALGIHWREEGGPPVETPTREGFGTRLIKHVAAMALRADVIMAYHPDGLYCQMTIPRKTLEVDQ
ncbi:PAS domain S-box protein [Brevundimonas viscosa]|uniref:histidine kinase n=1 Tax=Brevundimonas viscosa TaxID=871741 RepID=A0A1I6TQC2_9CAUL|nr:PAS domain S-box protein [Brevundimonas viscosa]SFS91439.1 PAS domain S-box-containing protein [Brevundimonas viscosa]